jgi:hypothetical protein
VEFDVFGGEEEFGVGGEVRALNRTSGSSFRSNSKRLLMLIARGRSTYDHRSVRTGHPVRNHEVSIVFVVPGTKILEKDVVIHGNLECT